MKLSGLVPMQALGMSVNGHTLVKESEEMCPDCGKPMTQCECMGEGMDQNVANGLPQTQGDEKKLTLSREHFKNIVREVMKEEGEYQKVFHKLLNKFGVKSPAELSDEQKKKFFSLAKGIQTELAERMKIKEAELSAGQKKLDVDGDGEIEGSDLAKLRSKNESKKGKKLKEARDADGNEYPELDDVKAAVKKMIQNNDVERLLKNKVISYLQKEKRFDGAGNTNSMRLYDKVINDLLKH